MTIILLIAALVFAVLFFLGKKKTASLQATYDAHIDACEKDIAALKQEIAVLEHDLEKCREGNKVISVIDRVDEKPVASKTKARKSFFEFFTDADGHYRWRFKAKNNKIVADSGEGYTTKQNLKKGLAALSDAITSGDYNIKWKK